MWLRRMTRNLSVSWLRAASYRRALAERHGTGNPDAAHGNPVSQNSMRREGLERVREGLNTLRPRIRDALILYYLEGQSVVEAAKALGITREAMKSRLHKGRTELRAYFESSWEDDLTSEMLDVPVGAMKRPRVISSLADREYQGTVPATLA